MPAMSIAGASPKAELYLYGGFPANVDDLNDVTAGGTAGSPGNAIDNDTGTAVVLQTAATYLEIDFGNAAFIKKFRYFGSDFHNEDGLYTIAAYINGAWVNVKTGIPTRKGSWSPWIDLTIPSTGLLWRVINALDDTHANGSRPTEFEFHGVRLGA